MITKPRNTVAVLTLEVHYEDEMPSEDVLESLISGARSEGRIVTATLKIVKDTIRDLAKEF